MTGPLAIPPRAVRRRHVLTLFATYPVGVLLLHAALGGSTGYASAHLVFTVALLAWSIPRVHRVGKAIGDDVDDRLDERQLAERNAAYLDAYRVVAAVVVLGLIWMAIGTDKGFWWIPSTYNEWNDLIWGAFLLTLNLPSAFLMWRAPDADDVEAPATAGARAADA